MRLDLPAVFFSTALACAVTANAAPFAVGRSTHVTVESTNNVPAGPATSADQEVPEPLAAGGGLVINATFDGSITDNPKRAAIEGAIDAAIQVFEGLLEDRITVSIRFRYSTTYADGTPLPSGAVSVSESPIYILPWSMFVDALKADATSADDAKANAH